MIQFSLKRISSVRPKICGDRLSQTRPVPRSPDGDKNVCEHTCKVVRTRKICTCKEERQRSTRGGQWRSSLLGQGHQLIKEEEPSKLSIEYQYTNTTLFFFTRKYLSHYKPIFLVADELHSILKFCNQLFQTGVHSVSEFVDLIQGCVYIQ